MIVYTQQINALLDAATPNAGKNTLFINSFYSKLPLQKLSIIYEFLKCFLLFDFNAKKAYNYKTHELNSYVSENVISKVFKEIRMVIYKYMKISYPSNLLGEKDEKKFFHT